MRRGLLPVLALVAVAACGGEEPRSSDPSTTTEPTTASTPAQPTGPTGTTTPPGTGPTTTERTAAPPATTPPIDGAAALPDTWLRYGADGLVLASADREQLLVDRPIGWAASDGAGGVLFTDWNPDRFGPTWWLPGGGFDPVLVSEWDDLLFAARVDGQPAAVGSLPTAECGQNGVVHMVALLLTTGATATLACGVGGQDAGREPDSFGGGLYVGVEWNAVHASGRSTDLRLLFRDASGAPVDLATNPFADDCSPCELTAAPSPDAARLAVISRPDAPPFRPDELASWLESTSSTDAELRVVDLATGGVQFSAQLPAGTSPTSGTWFDGRFVALAPDLHTHPFLGPGDRGEPARELQRLLVDHGAGIEIDGIYGPGTTAAVEAFHTARFGSARSTVGPDTWAELGVPSVVIDTTTGMQTELSGRIALEVILADVPAPGVVVWPAAPAELVEMATLRADGIGPFPFDADATEVEAWLAGQLGEPDVAVVEPGELGWPMPSCAERRFSYWADAGLTVGYTDLIGYDATDGVADCDDAANLAAWYVSTEGPPWFAPDHGELSAPPLEHRLTVADGIGLYATAGDLRAANATVTFGEWDVDAYAPAIFATADGLRGRVDWDPVTDVQQALNEHGAGLPVDGTFGPRTEAALAEFQQEQAIDELDIGSLTLAALGVAVPDEAPIVYLAAGRWDWRY